MWKELFKLLRYFIIVCVLYGIAYTVFLKTIHWLFGSVVLVDRIVLIAGLLILLWVGRKYSTKMHAIIKKNKRKRLGNHT
jgi:hypothetical protein